MKTVAAVGFPLGQSTSKVKRYEIQDAVDLGTDEIDMVINIRALQSNKIDIVKEEVHDLVTICSENKKVSKIIIETCYLNFEQKVLMCEIAKDFGVDYIKTSTGFGTYGATVDDVKLLKKNIGVNVKIKASGGIRSFESALELIKAGASRIGTSSGTDIIKGHLNINKI